MLSLSIPSVAFGKRVTGYNRSSFAFERDRKRVRGIYVPLYSSGESLLKRPSKEKFDFVSDEQINRDKMRIKSRSA